MPPTVPLSTFPPPPLKLLSTSCCVEFQLLWNVFFLFLPPPPAPAPAQEVLHPYFVNGKSSEEHSLWDQAARPLLPPAFNSGHRKWDWWCLHHKMAWGGGFNQKTGRKEHRTRVWLVERQSGQERELSDIPKSQSGLCHLVTPQFPRL